MKAHNATCMQAHLGRESLADWRLAFSMDRTMLLNLDLAKCRLNGRVACKEADGFGTYRLCENIFGPVSPVASATNREFLLDLK